jgi:hypothetical protein
VLEAADREAWPVGLLRNADIPRELGTSGSVTANTTYACATPAFVIQFLAPSITQPSPSRLARVRIARGSDPASGSERVNAASHSPLARRGSTRCLSSSDPARRIGSDPRSWTASSNDDEAQAAATSSMATQSMSGPVPVPP